MIANSVFETLSKVTQELLQNIMSTPIEAIDIEVVTAEESVPKIVIEAEEVAPEVVEVLVEVHKSPRTLRPKPTPTKESTKDTNSK